MLLNKSNDFKEQEQNLTEAFKNLNKAMIVNKNIEKMIYGKKKMVLKPHYQKIDKLYAVATYRISTIDKELNKKDLDKEKIKIYLTDLIETIYSIEQEQGQAKLIIKRP